MGTAAKNDPALAENPETGKEARAGLQLRPGSRPRARLGPWFQSPRLSQPQQTCLRGAPASDKLGKPADRNRNAGFVALTAPGAQGSGVSTLCTWSPGAWRWRGESFLIPGGRGRVDTSRPPLPLSPCGHPPSSVSRFRISLSLQAHQWGPPKASRTPS